MLPAPLSLHCAPAHNASLQRPCTARTFAAARGRAGRGRRAVTRGPARRGIQALYKARSRRAIPRRRSGSREAPAACMAPTRRPAGAHLLLLYAGLLAAAAGLVPQDPSAPSGSRVREKPPPGNELPAGSGESRAGPATRLPVRRRDAQPAHSRPGPTAADTSGPQFPHPESAPP